MFVCQPYSPRAIAFTGIADLAGYRLKQYTVVYGDQRFDAARFADGVDLAAAALPQPATTTGRPGLGLIIRHQGRGADYVVLGWWDRENELPLRVFVSPDGQPQSWRPSAASESICVWDLEILWAEREAYVATVLSPRGGDVEGYLARVGGNDPGQSRYA